MKKYFGTDGIRGLANSFPLDPITINKIGMAVGSYFMFNNQAVFDDNAKIRPQINNANIHQQNSPREKYRSSHRVVIGKDTRLSGYMIENAIVSGFIAMGMDVFIVGPLPTPAVSMLTKSLRADIGVMISASHNAYYDNGIKFFDAEGRKFSDETEAKIENLIEQDLTPLLAPSHMLGRAKRIEDAVGRYIEYVKRTFPVGLNLRGLRIVLDCANGASYKIAPKILWELGAEVIEIATTPDGFNINRECGSTNLLKLKTKVLEYRADIGIALDGDADRLIAIDEQAKKIDGDSLMAAISVHLQKMGRLKGEKIVATIMSNGGLEEFLHQHNLGLIRSKVGDRYVIEQMQANNCNFGGEQSGHLIFSDFISTGDGILSSLQLLAILKQSGKRASQTFNLFNKHPQVVRNISLKKNSDNPLEKQKIKDAIAKITKQLTEPKNQQHKGRLIVRKSGTEPLIRIMVECLNAKIAEELAEELSRELTGEIGLHN